MEEGPDLQVQGHDANPKVQVLLKIEQGKKINSLLQCPEGKHS